MLWRLFVFVSNDFHNYTVLTPYRKQRTLLRKRCDEAHSVPRDIDTTDAFQGLENRIVIVSLVSVGQSRLVFADTVV